MKVVRERYLKQLRERMHNGLVKIITGIRRCGKSYLLGVLFKEYLESIGVDQAHIIEVALDKDEFQGIRDAIRLGEYIRSRIVDDGKWTYVFVDEVQLAKKVLPDGVDLNRYAPEDREEAYVTFYDVLNGLRQMKNVDVYVTGSNSKTLSKDIDTNFADRGYQIRMHPFSFSEYCQALQPEDKAEAFSRYLVWGGMPLAVAEATDDGRARYLKGLFSEVYLKDIKLRHKLRDDFVLAKLIDVISSATGSLTNPHKLRDTLESTMKIKAGEHTIVNYIEHLTDAFLFSESKRWDVKGKSYFDYPVKYYAEDMGLRNARLDFRDVEPSHSMENVIYSELIRRGCSVDVGVVRISGRDESGRQFMRQHEIDFVVNRAPGKIYIQSAWRLSSEEKRRQELLPLRQCDDFFKKIIVSEGYAQPMQDEFGIVHVGVIPFLLDEGFLESALKE